MSNTIPNRQVICQVLLERAKKDPDLVVLCSDSRGSASLAPFAKEFPQQFVEMGIAEQSLVSTAAGMARCGMRPFAASPASFLSTRSMEQVKVDVAYSHTNVKLIGISGGISYGALGMTHHSAQDIAVLASIPGMRVYLPSDRFLTQALMEVLVQDNAPAYIRVGRNAVEDVYDGVPETFQMDKALTVKEGRDVTLIACGEMVKPALDAASALEKEGISARVLDMYCVKPLDREAVEKAARETRAIVTVEEHSLYGGMGSMVSQVVGETHPVKVKNLALPDEPAIAGKSGEVFAHYGLDAQGIAKAAREVLV
ncbi:MAG: transketolase family protein [Acutalibacter sp.]|jgi:transketolase